MKVKDLLADNTNVQLIISGADLIEFGATIANEILAKTFMKEEKNDGLLSVNDACKLLHKDRSSLWRWAKQGYLTPVEIGGSRMYRKCDIDKLMEGK